MGCDRKAKSTAKRTRGLVAEATEVTSEPKRTRYSAGTKKPAHGTPGPPRPKNERISHKATPAYRASKRLTPASDTSEIQRAYERASDTSERAIRASERAGDRMQHAGEVMAG